MTFYVFGKATAQAGVIYSILPVILGGIRFRVLSPAFRMLWGWLLFGFMVSISMWVSGSHGQKTAMITQLTFPVFATLGLRTIGMLSESPAVRRWCNIATVGYLLFWGWRFLHDEAKHDYSLFTGPVLWVILTVASATLIRVRLSASPPNVFRDPGLVTAIAVLVSYAPLAALEPVSAALDGKHPDLVLMLWFGKAVLMMVATTLFTLVYLWTLPPRSSPGFLSSVASPPAR